MEVAILISNMVALKEHAGKSYPLGATVCPEGVNFAIYSKRADYLELLLFCQETYSAAPWSGRRSSGLSIRTPHIRLYLQTDQMERNFARFHHLFAAHAPAAARLFQVVNSVTQTSHPPPLDDLHKRLGVVCRRRAGSIAA